MTIFDVVVVRGGPSGATAAHDLAHVGRTVLRRERTGRIKPCGGAIPPRLISDFDIPDELLVARVNGQGIYYAMIGGRLAAEAVNAFLETGHAKALRTARKRFMRMHGIVFWILGVMQWYWYSNDRRRERFVSICRDRDVQKLTWDAYMNKELVRAKPVARIRIFFKNLAHMAGLASA
jgi:flavin-dependent dehydrogenase